VCGGWHFFILYLAVLQGNAYTQDAEESIPSMFKRAEEAKGTYGEYSYEYRAILYEILGKIQNNPKNRQATKHALLLILLNMWWEAHPSVELNVLVVLGGMEFEDGECKDALRHLHCAKQSILILRGDQDAAQKWPMI